jgi:uncharacterized membrane protein YjgN (DUF898 family)
MGVINRSCVGMWNIFYGACPFSVKFSGSQCYRTVWVRVLNTALAGILLYFATISRIFGVARHSCREGSDLQL